MECDQVILVPLKYEGHAIEQVLMLDFNSYPTALFHIDFLWTTDEHRDIHDKLNNGETVTCTLSLKEI